MVLQYDRSGTQFGRAFNFRAWSLWITTTVGIGFLLISPILPLHIICASFHGPFIARPLSIACLPIARSYHVVVCINHEGRESADFTIFVSNVVLCPCLTYNCYEAVNQLLGIGFPSTYNEYQLVCIQATPQGLRSQGHLSLQRRTCALLIYPKE